MPTADSPTAWGPGQLDIGGDRYRVADLDNDGRDDLTAFHTDGTFHVWRAKATNGFTAEETWGSNGTLITPDRYNLADVNNDSAPDIVSFEPDAKFYVWTANEIVPADSVQTITVSVACNPRTAHIPPVLRDWDLTDGKIEDWFGENTEAELLEAYPQPADFVFDPAIGCGTDGLESMSGGEESTGQVFGPEEPVESEPSSDDSTSATTDVPVDSSESSSAQSSPADCVTFDVTAEPSTIHEILGDSTKITITASWPGSCQLTETLFSVSIISSSSTAFAIEGNPTFPESITLSNGGSKSYTVRAKVDANNINDTVTLTFSHESTRVDSATVTIQEGGRFLENGSMEIFGMADSSCSCTCTVCPTDGVAVDPTTATAKISIGGPDLYSPQFHSDGPHSAHPFVGAQFQFRPDQTVFPDKIKATLYAVRAGKTPVAVAGPYTYDIDMVDSAKTYTLTHRYGDKDVFDFQGWHVKSIDRNGNETVYGYDLSWREIV